MALAYTKTQVEIREISLKDRPDELYEASSKGTVPVLITIDKVVIDESLEIMLWALKNSKTQTWIKKDHDSELHVINENDTSFKKWLDRYKYHDRFPEASKEFYRKKCEIFLFKHENHLKKTENLLQDKMNIVDVALFPFIRQFANVDICWFNNTYPELSAWLQNFTSSNLFNEVMTKHDTWKSSSQKQVIVF